MSKAERVARLREQPPTSLDVTALRDLLVRSQVGRSSRLIEMAEILVRRYCLDEPEQYTEIGKRLGITPEHARRLGNRALVLLSVLAFAPDSTIQRGTRLWLAIQKIRRSS